MSKPVIEVLELARTFFIFYFLFFIFYFLFFIFYFLFFIFYLFSEMLHLEVASTVQCTTPKTKDEKDATKGVCTTTW